MSEQKLIEASGLIKAKKYTEARKILTTLPNDPTAQGWLKKLDEMESQSKFNLDESDILDKARQLIKEKKYDQARNALKHISHNPTAQSWLQKIDELDDPFADTLPSSKVSPSMSARPISNPIYNSHNVQPYESYGNEGYIGKNLSSGEYIIFKTKHHWSIVIRNFLSVFIISILLLTPYVMSGPINATPNLIPVALCLSAPIILLSLIQWSTSEFGVTNKKVIMKTGFIVTKSLELNISKIETFQVDNTLFGQLLGFKSITIIGSGGTKQTFVAISHAQEFRRYVTELMG